MQLGDVALGRYRLVRVLGEGGMGRVYLAEHTRLGTRVALKVLLSHDTPDLLARFVSEAELMARIQHPNAVTVVDFGHTPSGHPILAMEFVEGQSLGDVLEEHGSLQWQLASWLVEQALAGLEAAHQLGIVHRDIKPANILVSDGDMPTVKLADFGIAKVTSGPKRTATGFIIGTPDYMAPEVLAGKPATPCSDVYSMATTLYELITGRLPFPDEALARFEREAPPLEAPAGREAIPWQLGAVVAKCLSKSASARIQSADELAEALRPLRPRGRPPKLPPRTRKPKPEPPPPPPEPAATVAPRRKPPPLDLPEPEEAAPITNSIRLVVAALPAARLATTEERRHLASLVGANGRGYSVGGGIWFAVLGGADAERTANAVREALAKRYGSFVRAVVESAPEDFKLTTTQLAGAVELPAPLPGMIRRVTE